MPAQKNYFPFNILRATERNFEVYLNPGNIALAFLELVWLFQTCFKATLLYKAMCIWWMKNWGKLLNNSTLKIVIIQSCRISDFFFKLHSSSCVNQNTFVALHNPSLCNVCIFFCVCYKTWDLRCQGYKYPKSHKSGCHKSIVWWWKIGTDFLTFSQ